jgi:hypothetical protein
MKTQLSNIALGGTCSGDVVGGLLSWTEGILQALLFLKGGNHRPEKERAARRRECDNPHEQP